MAAVRIPPEGQSGLRKRCQIFRKPACEFGCASTGCAQVLSAAEIARGVECVKVHAVVCMKVLLFALSVSLFCLGTFAFALFLGLLRGFGEVAQECDLLFG